MDRYIVDYNPAEITSRFIDSTEWDIIELPWKIDIEQLQDWYNIVDSEYDHLYFSWRKSEYLKDKYHLENIDNAFDGDIGQAGRGVYDQGYHIVDYIKNTELAEILVMEVSWYCEKEIPGVPSWAGRKELYPECWLGEEKSIQQKFDFGYVKFMKSSLGEQILKDLSIRKHQPTAVLGKHVDGPNVQRLHIPIDTDNEAKFLYGQDLEREYNLLPGKAYIINAAVPHGTVNNSKNNRAHLQSKPINETVVRIAGMKWNSY